MGTKRNNLPFLWFMDKASVAVDHVTVWEVNSLSLSLYDQEGPTDRMSTSTSAMWEARAYKSPYENSDYTRAT